MPPPRVGRPSNYCADPQHNPSTANRARQRLRRRADKATATRDRTVDDPAGDPGGGVAELIARLERAEALAEERAQLLLDLQRRADEREAKTRHELAAAHSEIALLRHALAQHRLRRDQEP